MGIKNLARLLSDEAEGAVKNVPLSSLNGNKIGIDASMQIYQALIAIRTGGDNFAAQQLTNAEGETTSHIQGMFNKTIRYLSEGIRPAYVFDGKPPPMKSGELLKRREKREKATEELKKAKEDDDIEAQNQQQKRLVRAGTKENNDCKKLIRLMGCPVIEAPMEAEAQCAQMAKDGIIWASATEDMDCVTFGTPRLLRKLTFAGSAKNIEVQLVDYSKAISGLGLTHDQFVDLCIMMGCDYCETIRGVGPKTALKLIREHKNIETILKKIDRKKHVVPPEWVPDEQQNENENENENENGSNTTTTTTTTTKTTTSDGDGDGEDKKPAPSLDPLPAEPVYVSARRLFNQHEVLTAAQIKESGNELKWVPAKSKELQEFLVSQGFNEERVAKQIEKLEKAKAQFKKPQLRMDSFFGAVKAPNADMLAKKRAAEKDAKGKGKKAKTAAGGKNFFGKRK